MRGINEKLGFIQQVAAGVQSVRLSRLLVRIEEILRELATRKRIPEQLRVEESSAELDVYKRQLTGTIYSDTAGKDDAEYNLVEPHLRALVGRLINDKMPTGVAVSPAMNHGGPFPATGHPGLSLIHI